MGKSKQRCIATDDEGRRCTAAATRYGDFGSLAYCEYHKLQHDLHDARGSIWSLRRLIQDHLAKIEHREREVRDLEAQLATLPPPSFGGK